jgi:hypothetical protein
MVEYLKTKKGYFYKLKKNGEKKRISQEEYNKKSKTRKNKKMIGRGLTDLDSLDVSIKTIILMGEVHTNKKYLREYLDIIKKQKEIIDLTIDKFGADKTYFYSEAPEEFRKLCLTTDVYSSSSIAQYAITKIPIKLSSVGVSDRADGDCDDKFVDDILSIFHENVGINCIIVAIGLLHVPEVKRFIVDRQPDIKIIVVNTVSKEHLIPLIPEIKKKYPLVLDLLTIEPPYELPKETFIVDVLYNTGGKKIYKCPRCKTVTGSSAAEDPTNTSLFGHCFDCPNKNKIPIEE